MAAETLFRRGDRIAEKYVVEDELGRGGMAVVVAARHAELGHEVAIKALLPAALRHEAGADRLLREARAAARLQSEHATRVFDVGRLPGGAPFIVLERLRGMDLHALLEAHGPLPVGVAARAVREACDAVAEAHDGGIVHRDLKPSNLFLARRRDGSALVKVLDFGIAKASASPGEAALTTTSSSLGTPLYMAPEQILDAKSVTAAVDVWALGVTLYELLTDAIPWDVQSVHALLAKIVTERPLLLRQRRSDLPAGLEEVVMRCLARAPEDRYPDARALAAALAPYASPTPLVLPTSVDLDAPTNADASIGLVAADTDVSAPPSAVIRDTTTNPLHRRQPQTKDAPTRRQAESPASAVSTGLEWGTRGAAHRAARGRWALGGAVAALAIAAATGAALTLRNGSPSAPHASDPTTEPATEPATATVARPEPSPGSSSATEPPSVDVVEAMPGARVADEPSDGVSAPRPGASASTSALGSAPPAGSPAPRPRPRPASSRAASAAPPAVPSPAGTSPSGGWGPMR